MEIDIIDNFSNDLASILSKSIEQANDVRIAVAFVSQRGLEMISSSINHTMDKGANIEFLVGLDMRTTEPEALQSLYILSKKNDNFSLYCHASLTPSSLYHPKLYLLKDQDKVISIIGSSNLTQGGLSKNIEVNLVIKATVRDEIISDACAIYNRLKFHPRRVVPDEEFISYYSILCNSEKSYQRKFSKEKDNKKALKTFEDKALSLQRPKAKDHDLIGWLKLVFDYLPDKEFTTQQIYSHENEFSLQYPENRN